MQGRIVALVAVVGMLAVACTPGAEPTATTASTSPSSSVSTSQASTTAPSTSTTPTLPFAPAPDVPSGPLGAETVAAIDAVWEGLGEGRMSTDGLRALAVGDDARVAWLIADLLRFVIEPAMREALADAAAELTGLELGTPVPWVALTDHLIAWDLPAPPGYVDYKRELYTLLEPRWGPFLTEPNAIDERWISWGGVGIDARPFGSPDPCDNGCIPALDDPGVTDAAGGDWYPDEGIVFGVVVEGEARAYPRHIMETHELVNDTLGGERIGLPYCTLCGSAQLYLTGRVEGFEVPVLRTSGLLNRSNKVMYDLRTGSVIDTFTGEAAAGPLWEAGVVLPQGSVITTTWGEWKAEHPDTTIVASDGGIGRTYDPDPLRGRDDEGPIFPIGDRDLRLGVQEPVVGVIAPDGTPVAFPAAAAEATLKDGGPVELAGVRLIPTGGGLAAETTDGDPLPSHQAFWFAWSQFQPDTELWEPPG